MDAEWAALNAAQQAAFVASVVLGLYVMYRMTSIALDRKWPLPLGLVMVIMATAVAAIIMTLVVGALG